MFGGLFVFVTCFARRTATAIWVCLFPLAFHPGWLPAGQRQCSLLLLRSCPGRVVRQSSIKRR